MRNFTHFIPLIIFFISAAEGFSQDKEEKKSFPMFGTSFGVLQPGGFMAKRFGLFMTAGFKFDFMLQSKWLFGLDFNYGFTNNIKENTLTNITNDDGFIVNNEGNPADVRITGRLWYLIPCVEYKTNWANLNMNSGIVLGIGAGYTEHRIIFFDYAQTVASLDNQLYRGYDRYSGGLAFRQSIGFLYIGTNRLTNFRIDLILFQFYTKNFRELNYDTGLKDAHYKFNFCYSIKGTWILPLYKKTAEGIFYTE
jgi:hypothetical protein